MGRMILKRISITELETDAVVNAANEGLWAGGGVCGAIFRAAGAQRLQEACSRIGHCDTGSAVITPGFDLKAKYIIHAVGPRWRDGRHGEPALLRGAYTKAMELAEESGCRSVGFPLISAGIFGYPVQAAWETALAACRDYQEARPETAPDAVFAVLDDAVLRIGQEVLMSLQGNLQGNNLAEEG